MRSRRRLLSHRGKLGGLLLAFALVAAACAPEAEPTTQPPVTEAPAATTQPPTTVEKPVIVVADSTDVDILEPHTFRTTGAYTITRAVYQPLAEQIYDEQGALRVGTTEVGPSPILESYSFDQATREARVVVHPDAKFENGEPILAEDIAYTLIRSIEGPGYIGLLLPFIGISSRDQVEVVDDRTLVIRPEVASPLFNRFMVFQVFGPMDKTLAEEVATKDDPWAFSYFTDNANSSGPYQIVEFDRARGQIVLEPNPGYPGEVANGGVIVRSVPDAEQRALLLQRGEIDVGIELPSRLLAEIQDDPNINVFQAPSTRSIFLVFNTQQPPLDNKLVRQAISYAIPYDALLNQVMFGFARKAGTLIPSTMETYQGDDIGTYSLDLDRARELLEESGLGDISLEIIVEQSRGDHRSAAVFIQDSLRQIGIDAEVVPLPDADFQERRNNREFQVAFHEWYSWGDDPFYHMTFLIKCEQFTNFSGYCDEELDEIIAEGTFELDPQRRLELSRRAQEIMLEDAPQAWLWAADWVVAARSNITGVTKDFTEVPRLETLSKEG